MQPNQQRSTAHSGVDNSIYPAPERPSTNKRATDRGRRRSPEGGGWPGCSYDYVQFFIYVFSSKRCERRSLPSASLGCGRRFELSLPMTLHPHPPTASASLPRRPNRHCQGSTATLASGHDHELDPSQMTARSATDTVAHGHHVDARRRNRELGVLLLPLLLIAAFRNNNSGMANFVCSLAGLAVLVLASLSAAQKNAEDMVNGALALLAQNESWDAVLSISYLPDPKFNSDFTTLLDTQSMRELDRGHTCVKVPDPPSTVKAGSNATLQIKYVSEFDKPENETFYACADITYIPFTDFRDRIPCFNATEPGRGKAGNKTGSKSAASSSSVPSASAGGSGSGLSGGAIAGIVVGVLVGVCLLAAAGLVIYRRKQQRMRLLRRHNSARGVKWDDQVDRDSHNSTRSVQMHNLST
ncbi:hypothetical protein RJ55_00967 [Drechmeria coniospora]|nr:hypothetical protein RJ55_00967 [Drechmeria coniospora]